MKILRVLLIILAVLFGILIVLSLLGPKTFDVSRSIVIDASPEQVFPYVSHFEKMNRWSPWADRDTNMTQTLDGADGTVGTTQSWEGNEDVGKGAQTITEIEKNEKVLMDLKFIEPWESQADVFIYLKDTLEGQTKVTWGFEGENGFIERIMFLFMDLDDAVGGDYEEGLSQLKKIVETEVQDNPARALRVEESDFTGRTYAGIRDLVKIDSRDMQRFFAENFGKVYAMAGENALSQPSALYFSWDVEKMETDMAAATAVAEPVEGLTTFEVPEGKMLTVNYYGDYAGIGSAHEAMDEYIAMKGYNMKSPVIEEYVTDPEMEKDTARWLTKVMYIVEK